VLGTVVALALFNAVILPIRFPQVLYKKLIGEPLFLSDLADIDEEIMEQLGRLPALRDDGRDIGMAFTMTVDYFGVPKEVPLKEGMEDVPVTNDNVDEYVDAYRDFLLNDSVASQFEGFRRGWNKVCKHPCFAIFTADELDVMISGAEVMD